MTATKCVKDAEETLESHVEKFRGLIGKVIKTYCRGKGLTTEDYEDVDQEAMVALIKARDSYRPAHGTQMGTHVYWEVLGAVSHWLTRRRARNRVVGTRMADTVAHLDVCIRSNGATPPSLSGQAQRGDAAFEALVDLAHPKCRHLLRLVYRDGLTLREVAAAVGRSESAVQLCIATERERIRGKVEAL